jgi:hypothetical protein
VLDVPVGDGPQSGIPNGVRIPLYQEEHFLQFAARVRDEPSVNQKAERVGIRQDEKWEGDILEGRKILGDKADSQGPWGFVQVGK